MLTPAARTVLGWAALGVAVGVVAALAVAVTVALHGARGPAAILVVTPVPAGWVAGLAGGLVAAAGRGGGYLAVLGAATAVPAVAFPVLAPVPLLFAAVSTSLPGWNRGRRVLVGVAVVLAGGIGLVGVPVNAALLARGGPPWIGPLVGAAVGLVVAYAVVTRHGRPAG